MAKGNEGRLIDKIHRQTDKRLHMNRRLIYRQKMNMAPGSTSGTPDVYYESFKGNLWVEYKVIDKWQGRRVVPVNKVTELQKAWLTRCTNNCRPCAVIIGDAKGICMILTGKDMFNPGPVALQTYYTPNEVAEWIASQVVD